MRSGIGIGSVVGALLSWTTFHSIVWAAIAACFGWAYVIYFVFSYGFR